MSELKSIAYDRDKCLKGRKYVGKQYKYQMLHEDIVSTVCKCAICYFLHEVASVSIAIILYKLKV